MNPAKYHECWLFSGVVPGVPTRPANHAALRQSLSAAGVTVIVLWELLLLNAEIENETGYITEQGIHGCRERIGEAARGVGALALADYMPVFPDTDIVPETRGELKTLLSRFAKTHAAELAADITRHGDPRAAPGFDKRKARKEVDRVWIENNRRYERVDRIPSYVEPLKRLRELLAQGISLKARGLLYQGISLAKQSREDEAVANLLLMLQHDFPRWAEEQNPPEVAAFLEECRRLTEQYPEQLPLWPARATAPTTTVPVAPVTQDRDLLYKLFAIGSYAVEQNGSTTTIAWGELSALDNDLAPVRLLFRYDGEFPPGLLTAWDKVRAWFAKAMPAMKQQLLEFARDAAKQVADAELRPEEDELLAQVTQGALVIYAEADYGVRCAWDVEWDPEHGCEFQIDEAGGISRIE